MYPDLLSPAAKKTGRQYPFSKDRYGITPVFGGSPFLEVPGSQQGFDPQKADGLEPFRAYCLQ